MIFSGQEFRCKIGQESPCKVGQESQCNVGQTFRCKAGQKSRCTGQVISARVRTKSLGANLDKESRCKPGPLHRLGKGLGASLCRSVGASLDRSLCAGGWTRLGRSLGASLGKSPSAPLDRDLGASRNHDKPGQEFQWCKLGQKLRCKPGQNLNANLDRGLNASLAGALVVVMCPKWQSINGATLWEVHQLPADNPSPKSCRLTCSSHSIAEAEAGRTAWDGLGQAGRPGCSTKP